MGALFAVVIVAPLVGEVLARTIPAGTDYWSFALALTLSVIVGLPIYYALVKVEKA